MNKPKYKIGDRIKNWTVTRVSYSEWFEQWVYDLQLREGKRKLTVTETTLQAIFVALISQNN